jgi:prepilin peptidase CpaA
MIELLSLAVFPTLMIIAGAGDAISMRIPNWLTVAIALAFFPMAFATAMPWAMLGMHVVVGIAMFILGFVCFSFGLFGGGDAKLLAAAGLWLGWPELMPFLMMTAFAGGILALCVMAWSLIDLNAQYGEGRLVKRLRNIKPNVPYGYAFAIGAILAFPDSWWMPSGA